MGGATSPRHNNYRSIIQSKGLARYTYIVAMSTSAQAILMRMNACMHIGWQGKE